MWNVEKSAIDCPLRYSLRLSWFGAIWDVFITSVSVVCVAGLSSWIPAIGVLMGVSI